MLGLAHRGWSLHDYGHHLVHTLRDLGYHSVLIGEQHISKRPDQIGYDQVIKIDTTRVDDVAPVTIDLLRDPPGRPWFMTPATSVGTAKGTSTIVETTLRPGNGIRTST